MKVAWRVACLERVDAAVLEEATEDRPHADRLGHPVDAGAEHADRAGADVDLHAGLRRRVQLLDQHRVDELVELDADARPLAGRCRCGDEPNLLEQLRPHREWRYQELANACGRPKPVMWLKRSATSPAISSSAVNRPTSSYRRAVAAL